MEYVIWDWNGTLWDDTWLCTEINNTMLRRRGLREITLEDYRENLCFPVSDYYARIGFNYEETSYEELAHEFIAAYEERRFECGLHPGARELICRITAQRIPQAVLSAYKHEALLQALDYFELGTSFDEVVGLNDVYAAGKFENGIAFIQRIDCSPEKVLLIGDTIHDFEVAQAMGVQCVLLACGHNSRSRLECCGVSVYDTFTDFSRTLG